MKKSYYTSMKVYKILLLICTLFIGIGAMAGGLCFIIKPDGSILQMQEMLVYFKKLPLSNLLFKNYTFPGIALIVVNGISNLIASYFILQNKKIGYIFGTIFGITLMLWICIQFYMFAPAIYAIDIVFFLIGLVQFIFGYCAYVNYKQIHFVFNESEYTNIDSTSKENVVIYFSRMGYTKKLAYKKANELRCGIYSIIPKEKIHGILGFWWCGRFGMHQWKMNTEDIKINLNEYKNIYLFTSMWVFHIAAPTRDFLEKYHKDLHDVHLSLVHFQNVKYTKEFERIENALNQKLLEKVSICCQNADIKAVNKID